MIDFSIIIPTYNRRDRLLNQIRLIYSQPQSKQISVVILDNHSDYDVEATLNAEFNEDQISNTKVIKYKTNIGGALNISMPFFFCETKWLWILSDDDRIEPDSLETIFSDIEKHPDIGIIKYSYSGYINTHFEDEIYSSMEELVGESGKKKQTAFLLISNAIYNLDVLGPFRGKIVQYSYNNIGALLPICYMLDAKAGKLLVRNKIILEYLVNDPGSGWNSFDLFVACGTFFDYPFNSSGKVLKKFWGGGPVPFNKFMKVIAEKGLYKDKIKCQMAFYKVWPYYLDVNCLKKLAYCFVFVIYKYTGIEISNTIYSLIKRKKSH